jgi:integrase
MSRACRVAAKLLTTMEIGVRPPVGDRNSLCLRIIVTPSQRKFFTGTPENFLNCFYDGRRAACVTEAGFGNWMRERCDEAGLPDCSSHGLRKAIARRMAEAGMSPHQIQAITGHTTLKEIERYTKAARQKLMAEMAMRGLDEPVAQIEDKR